MAFRKQNPSLTSPPPHSALALFPETQPRSTCPGSPTPGPNAHPYQPCPLFKPHTERDSGPPSPKMPASPSRFARYPLSISKGEAEAKEGPPLLHPVEEGLMAPSRLRFSLLFPTKGFPSGAWAWSRRHAAAPAHPTACSLGGGNSTGPLAVATAAAAASYLPALPTRSAQPPASCCPAVRIPRLPGRPDAARRPAPPSLRAGPRRSSCAPPLRRGHRLRPRPRPAPPGRPDPSQERTQVLRLLCSTGCHGDSSARSGQVALGARQPSIHPRAGGPSTWPHTQQKKSSKSSHQSSSHMKWLCM